MNVAPAYRTPDPRKSRSKRPPYMSPERWGVLVVMKRKLGYALFRGLVSEEKRAKLRAGVRAYPEALGGLKHL